jgi:hypothetical protein
MPGTAGDVSLQRGKMAETKTVYVFGLKHPRQSPASPAANTGKKSKGTPPAFPMRVILGALLA